MQRGRPLSNNGKEHGNYRHDRDYNILGFYRDSIGCILGLYSKNGRENGNYYHPLFQQPRPLTKRIRNHEMVVYFESLLLGGVRGGGMVESKASPGLGEIGIPLVLPAALNSHPACLACSCS